MGRPLEQEHHKDGQCECAYCSRELPFEMPEQLAEAFVKGDLVVFAGAGVSTEDPVVFPYTLYHEISLEAGIDPAGDTPFPSVMSAYQEKFGRVKLLAAIKKRIDYARSFPNLDRAASRFHRELSSAFTVTDIFTTNWDDYFERKCQATPFLTEKDWAFWKSSDRKVFKLHGSITSPGSVVATAADYEQCYQNLNEGLLGATLKTILATKTVVFIGYSFRDSDLSALYDLLKRRMEEVLPRAYLVTLDETTPPEVARDLRVIHTDARYFVEQLKAFYPADEFVPDDRVDATAAMRELVLIAHGHMLDEMEMANNGAVLLSACYHDGLLDAFGHQIANRASGDYSHRCYVEGMIGSYETLCKERLKAERYDDVAYIEGYINGLFFVIADDETRREFPMYLVFGCDENLQTFEQFRKAAKRAKKLDPKAHKFAERRAASLAPGIVLQHTPFLL